MMQTRSSSKRPDLPPKNCPFFLGEDQTLVSYFRKTLESEKALKELDKLKEGIKNICKLRTSKKHMSGIDLGKMEDDHALAIA